MADWSKILARGNIEDRRGVSGLGIGGGLGIIGVIVTVVFNFLSGNTINVSDVYDQLRATQAPQSSLTQAEFQGADDYETFTSTVLGSTTEYWQNVFAQNHKTYTPPKLVLFRTATTSGCGIAASQVGPHYCPADQTIYLDETFFNELQSRYQAKGGDVAQAYVIAHEVGHHAQNQLGIMDSVQSQSASSNTLSIDLELQADCYAGAWAHSVSQQGIFQPGEINEALDAAAAVGDDRIQQIEYGQVSPETWTHGSSEQRVHWFTTGFDSGDPSVCTTFS
jgi:predicted metalloprotease